MLDFLKASMNTPSLEFHSWKTQSVKTIIFDSLEMKIYRDYKYDLKVRENETFLITNRYNNYNKENESVQQIYDQ